MGRRLTAAEYVDEALNRRGFLRLLGLGGAAGIPRQDHPRMGESLNITIDDNGRRVYASSMAESIVNVLLENEKWDKALETYRHLYGLKLKAMDTFRELGRALEYERALAKAGVRKEDVHHHITADQIGATHNYKGKRPVKVCTHHSCFAKPLPVTTTACPKCGGPLTDTTVPWSASDLRSKIPRHIVGVELNDGRYVWFDKPLSNTPWTEWTQQQEERKPSAEDISAQGQLDKWV